MLVTAAAADTLAAQDAGPAVSRSVLLQGESASALRGQVAAVGGQITHFLPIINAVGARLSGEQLARLRGAPGISRIIDDLDHKDPQEEPQDTASCALAGGLELIADADSLRWALYNKDEPALHLRHLELAWPQHLGALKEVWLSERQLYPETGASLSKQEMGTASDAYKAELLWEPPVALPANSAATLQLRFEQQPAAEHAHSAFNLRLYTDADCTTELVPAYAEPGDNTWYPTVTGASLLHRNGITGSGITVALLDSGLWESAELRYDTRGQPRVLAQYDAITDRSDITPLDESGHGSHMSSIMARSGVAGHDAEGRPHFQGIAPDVQLVAVKAFSEAGTAELLDLVRGVQWVFDHRERYGIRVINLSFAARPRWPYWEDPLNQALMRLWQAGVVAVAAAGNEGPDPMSVGSPGNLPYLITVGAVTDSWTPETRDDDYLPDFSSRGPTPSGHIKPDLLAPGGHMAGITRPGSSLSKTFPEYQLRNGDFVMTGTSQAAALVSGIVALLLQLEPELSPDDVKCQLMSSADPAINLDGTLSYSPFEQGAGYLNLHRAIALGDRGCGNLNLDLARELRGQDHFRGPAIVDNALKPSLPGLEQIYRGTPSEKGMSDNRRWGVRAHIERGGARGPLGSGEDNAPGIDWLTPYLLEQQRVHALSKDPGDHN